MNPRLLVVFLFNAVVSCLYAQLPMPQMVKYNGPENFTYTTQEIPTEKIHFTLLNGSDSVIGAEGYHIQVKHEGIEISANTFQGQFYALQTLKQMRVNQIECYGIPACSITDYPHYSWRGMHLDVCRHFFPKDTVKRYIDLLASLKMNVLHLHLTDDQGWRLEIKKYPKLTETGAWRTEKDGSRYGGFYTQDDIKELVEYARNRFVTIVPEIEIPGHSSAAIAAYPQLSCDTAQIQVPIHWGIFKDIYCPTDYTFQFLKDVLDEVCELFPSTYIHLGGDEAPKERWKQSAFVQQLMHEKNLKDEEEVQHYVMKTMEAYLATKGRRSIGWGEVIKGGLNDSMVVMSWMDKYAGLKAAKAGHDVIMTPRFFCYFDYPQSMKDKKAAWWMTYLPLKKVYSFSPNEGLEAGAAKHILGGQANVWTEHIETPEKLAHQVYPRIAAMAEALWGKKTSYKAFSVRLARFNSGF
ncbi:MAG: beta-N-acetylhexosaminidase [Chitinophagales bacterium]